jgi:adenylate cyclase
MKIPFSLTLFLIIGALLLATAGVVTWNSETQHQQSLATVNNSLVEQAVKRGNDAIGNLLQQAEMQSRLMRETLKNGSLDCDNDTDCVIYMEALLKANPRVTALGIIRPQDDKSLVVSRRLQTADEDTLIVSHNHRTDLLIEHKRFYLSDFPEKPYRSDSVAIEPDSPVRKALESAIETMRPVWSETYVFNPGGTGAEQPGLTYVLPFRHPQTDEVILCSAEFSLYAISAYIGELLSEEPDIEGFVIELRNDDSLRLVAYSRPEVLLIRDQNDTNHLRLRKTTEIEDPVAKAFFYHYATAIPDAGIRPKPIHFEVNGTPYSGFYFLMRYSSVWPDENSPQVQSPKSELRWVIGIASPPRSDVLLILKNERFAMLFLIVTVLLALFISLIISRRIAKPLSRVEAELEAIGRLELDGETAVGNDATHIREINNLLDSTREMKISLRSFTKYIPAQIARRLAESDHEAQLGGERRRITILFTDIQGFTGLSEEWDPETLVDTLSEYNKAFTEAVADHDGTIDKFIGDSVMSIWGAPEACTTQTTDALLTALECQKREKSLRAKREAEGKTYFKCRMGVHTGIAVVGNFGSPSHISYTAIGDPVNVANAMEKLGKTYGTQINVSRETLDRAQPDLFYSRPLDRVRIKGKHEAIDVHELLGTVDDFPDGCPDWVVHYAEGLKSYLDQKWQDALGHFRDCLLANPHDRPSQLMIERCRHYQAHPPIDWTGVTKIK